MSTEVKNTEIKQVTPTGVPSLQKDYKEKPNAIAKVAERNITDQVLNRVNEYISQGRLHLPENYSVGNATASAWLTLQEVKDKNGRPALEVCTPTSVANALLDMVILGHNSNKKQGYFIVYGDKLAWFPSYFGKSASVKRLPGIKTEPIATIIYDGDEIELGHNELGEEFVVSHVTTWENKSKGKRIGVYVTVEQDGIIRSAVLTMAEVKEAWLKNPGQKRDHSEFEGEFMKRTAINRLAKTLIQTSNDDDLVSETFINNEYQHYEFENAPTVEKAEEKAQLEVDVNANTGEVIDVVVEEESEDLPVDNYEHEEVAQTPEVKPTPTTPTKNRGF